MKRWLLAAILWTSVAQAQVVSIPGAQISGSLLLNNIVIGVNPTTIQDSGIPLSGLTVGVISVGLTTSAASIYSTGPAVTSAGNLSFGLLTQSTNTVFAGPASGAGTVPTFRQLSGPDFPNQAANTFFGGPVSGAASAPVFRVLSNADLPNPSLSALGGIRAIAKAANRWIDAISTSGIPNESQPSFSDLSGTLSPSQFPILTGSVFNSLGSVTVTLTNGTVTNAQLASMSGGTFKGALSTGTPGDLTASAILDTIGNSQGQILFRGATQWTILPPGVSGSAFVTQGNNQNPLWRVVTSAVSTQQVLTSGSAATYTTPAGARQIKIRAWGGGGGGGAVATNNGSTGGDTIFNSIHAAGGLGGKTTTSGTVPGGAGGTGGTGTANFRLAGFAGGSAADVSTPAVPVGGSGGGPGGGVPTVGDGNGGNGVANSGGGGAGGTQTGGGPGGGGGSGEYIEIIINSPVASYVYTIAAGGNGGAAGGQAGGNGGTGLIIVDEFY